MAGEIVSLSSHAGTHVDAPSHYGPAVEGRARTIEEVPLSWLFGPGVVLDVRKASRGASALRTWSRSSTESATSPRRRRRARMDGDEPQMPATSCGTRDCGGTRRSPRRPRRTSHRHRRLGPGSSLRRHGGGGEGGRHRAAVGVASSGARRSTARSSGSRISSSYRARRASRYTRSRTWSRARALAGPASWQSSRSRERQARGSGQTRRHARGCLRSRISILFQDDHADRSLASVS